MVIKNTRAAGRVERMYAPYPAELSRDERVRQHPFRALRQHRFALRTGRSPGPHAAMAHPPTHSPQRGAFCHSSGWFLMPARRAEMAEQQLSLLEVADLQMPSGRATSSSTPQCERCDRPAVRRRRGAGYHRYCEPDRCRNIQRACGWCGIQFARTTPGAGNKYCSSACKVQGYRDGASYRPIRTVEQAPIQCAWCRKLATPERRHTAKRVWPFICPDCLAPIRHVSNTLIKHRVPHTRARRLLTDPGCEICGTDLLALTREHDGSKRPRLVVDHDHACCPLARYSCGKCVRGVICGNCNMALGLLRDSPAAARAAAGYLDAWASR